MSEKITSLANPKVKTWLSLLSGRGLKKESRFLLSGRKTVPEYIASNSVSEAEIIYSSNNPYPDFAGQHFQVSADIFRALDTFGTDHPLLVLSLPQLPIIDLAAEPLGLEVLCPLGDPSNLGALARTSVAMGVSKIILLTESAQPFHPKALRASAGTTMKAPFYLGPSLAEAVNLTNNESTFCLQATGQNIHEFTWPQNLRLIIGEEGQGLPENTDIKAIKIPMYEGVESLNAVVAASMAMYSYRHQHTN